MSEDIKKFHTRKDFDQAVWDDLVGRFHYTPGSFDDLGAFQQLKAEVARARRRVPAPAATSSSTSPSPPRSSA